MMKMRCPKHKYQTFIVALARGSLHAISFYVLESRLNIQRRRILSESSNPLTPPAQRVQFILGQESQDLEHESHPVFSEMEELYVGEDGNMEWKETARWVKFEEDVEEGGNRWSKPHVATLSLHSLFELRSLLLNGTVSLDMAASSLEEIADITLDNMINCGSLTSDKKDQVKTAMLKKHRHQFEGLKKGHPEHGMSSSKVP